MAAPSRPDTEEELRSLLELADELQVTLDQEVTRASSTWLIAVGGAILAVAAVVIVAVLEGGLAVAVVAPVLVAAAAGYGSLAQIFIRRPLLRRARRDERALSEVVRLLRESLGVIERRDDWSSFKRAEFRIRMARFQDTGDLPSARGGASRDDIVGSVETWGGDLVSRLSGDATRLDICIADLMKAAPSDWEGLAGFFRRGGHMRLALPDVREEHVRAHVSRLLQVQEGRVGEMSKNAIAVFNDARIRGGADPQQLELRLSDAVPTFDFMVADHGIALLSFGTADGDGGVVVSGDSSLLALLRRQFERVWSESVAVDARPRGSSATASRIATS